MIQKIKSATLAAFDKSAARLYSHGKPTDAEKISVVAASFAFLLSNLLLAGFWRLGLAVGISAAVFYLVRKQITKTDQEIDPE